MSTMQNDIQRRIALVRYVMIVGIVILHTPPYVPILEIGNGFVDQFKAFFQNAAFRATVPVLTLISGYLLFSSGLDQYIGRFAKKKFRTIVLPFLVFNLSLLGLAYFAEYRFGFSARYKLLPFDTGTWLDAAFGLTAAPINYPLNFLRDLVAVMILAPLMGVFLRRGAWLGLALLAIVFLNNMDGMFVLRDIMPIMFYIGGMAAIRQWNLRALDRFAWPCLLVFLALCMAVVHFRVANTNAFRFVAPFLIWPATALLSGNRWGEWLASQSKYSYFIFIAHAPLLVAFSLVYKRSEEMVPYALYWVSVPIVTVLLLTALYKLAMRIAPIGFSTIIGARTARAARSGAIPRTVDTTS